MTTDRRSAGQSGRVPTTLLLLLLGAIVCVNLIFPIVTLLSKSVDVDPFYKGFADVFTGWATREAFGNSVKITLLSSLIAVVAAFFYAYVVEFKLKRKLRRIFELFAILPMLVPSITHGLVITYLFGKMGIVTRITGVQLPIYGPLGIVMGSFFYAFPTAFLVLSQAFVNLDGRLFENAQILGVGPVRRFFDITLPMMKYPMFSAFAVCFTMIFTDYGVPLSVGGTYSILPLLFYKNVVGLLDFSKGAVYSTLLLGPAAAVYLLDVGYFSKKQAQSSRNVIRAKTGRFHPVQRVLFVVVTVVNLVSMAVILFAPFVTAWPYDLTPTLRHFERIISIGALFRLIGNSLMIAFATGLIGTALAMIAGYIYVRAKTAPHGLKKLTHGLYMVSLAVPGLALGLSYAMFFRGTVLQGTIWIMIVVNVIHFFGSPYMMVISHFKLLNPNLEAICRTLGGGWFRVIWDIILPNSKKMLTDVFVYFFTNTMITISAVSLLYSSQTGTLALQITAYNDQGAWESAVAVSLVILLINVLVKGWQLLMAGRAERRMRRTAEAPPTPPMVPNAGE